MDQPLADPSCIALYFVSKLASKYVKVVLSGEGADELFGGYTVYNEPHVFKLYQKIFNQKARTALANKARKMPHIKGRGFILRGERVTEEKFIGNAFLFDDKEKDEILKDTSIVTRPQDLCKSSMTEFVAMMMLPKCSISTSTFGWLVIFFSRLTV